MPSAIDTRPSSSRIDTRPSPTQTRSGSRRPSRTRRRLLAVTSLGLAGLVAGFLTGCANVNSSPAASSTSANAYAATSGNWGFSSSSAAAVRLSALGGSLVVNGTEVTGLLHPLATTNQCIDASTPIPVTGSIDAASRLTLSAPLSAGTLTIAGTLAADGKSLSAATYTVTGGACAFPSTRTVSSRDTAAIVTAQQYQPVSGTYTGALTSSEGDTFSLTSVLTQSTQPDADGVYHVTGTASSPGNPCVPDALTATASVIDGGSISTTYTDAVSGTTITGTGNSSPDGTSITITNWTISSPCGADSGTGALTRASN